MYEMNEEISILVDVPFAKEDDVRYRLANDYPYLDVNGKRISRSIKVPGVCRDIVATFKNGILELRKR